MFAQPSWPKRYIKVRSEEELLKAISELGSKAKIVAGGTLLYDLVKRGSLAGVDVFVDIEPLELSYVREHDGLVIGAMTTVSELLDSPLVRKGPYHGLVEALENIRPVQIRNMATIGGEVCSGFPMLDLPPVLLAFESYVRAISLKGERLISLKDLYLDYFLTSLKRGEYVREIIVPRPPPRTGSAFAKLERNAVDLALINTCALISLTKDGECHDAKLAFGASRTPVRIESVEAYLKGKPIDERLIEEASKMVKDELKPMPSVHASPEYKKRASIALAKDVLNRALTIAMQEA